MGVMTAIAVGGAVIGAAGGISKMVAGGKAKKAAKRALNKYKRQTFKNAHSGRTISTKGADIALDASARLAATSLDTLAAGGIRGSVGGVGQVQKAANDLSLRIGANQDEQLKEIESAEAREEIRIQTMVEQRQNADLNRLQQQLNAGAQTQASGLGDIAQAGFSVASMAASTDGFGGSDDKKPKTNDKGLTPASVALLDEAKVNAANAFGTMGSTAFG